MSGMSMISCLLLRVKVLKTTLAAMKFFLPRSRVASLSSGLSGVGFKFGFSDTARVVLSANLVVETRIGGRGVESAFGDVGTLWIVRGSALSANGPGV